MHGSTSEYLLTGTQTMHTCLTRTRPLRIGQRCKFAKKPQNLRERNVDKQSAVQSGFLFQASRTTSRWKYPSYYTRSSSGTGQNRSGRPDRRGHANHPGGGSKGPGRPVIRGQRQCRSQLARLAVEEMLGFPTQRYACCCRKATMRGIPDGVVLR